MVTVPLPFTTHKVWVLRPPKKMDAHGNLSRTTKDWSDAARLGPYPAVVQPDAAMLGTSLPTGEVTDYGQEQVETRIRVRFNPDVDVRSTDGIEVSEGQSLAGVYEVHGDPLDMYEPWGGLSHIDLKARRTRG